MPKKSTTYKGKPKPLGKPGWFNESVPHGMAARGIKSRMDSKAKINPMMFTQELTYLPNIHQKFSDEDIVDMIQARTGSGLSREFHQLARGSPMEKHSPSRLRYMQKFLEEKGETKRAGAIKRYLNKIIDTDKDGIPDAQDCDPLDPTKQDDLLTNVESETSGYTWDASVTTPESTEITFAPVTTDPHEPARRGIKAKIDAFMAKREQKAHEHRQKTLARLTEQIAVEKEKVGLEKLKLQERQLKIQAKSEKMRLRERAAKLRASGRLSIGGLWNPTNVWSGKPVRSGDTIKKPLRRRTKTRTRTTKKPRSKAKLPAGYKLAGGKVYKLVG